MCAPGNGVAAGTPAGSPSGPPADWLRINARKHAAQILQMVKLRAFNPRASEWQCMFALAAAFRARRGHLDAWDKHAHSWERGFDHARAWAERHGHLAIPADEKLDGHAVGAWMCRRRRNTKLTAVQDAKIAALEAMWRTEPDWNRTYQRLLAYLTAGGALDGPANRTGADTEPTFRPGAWLRKQDKVRTDGKLTGQQTALLDALHA